MALRNRRLERTVRQEMARIEPPVELAVQANALLAVTNVEQPAKLADWRNALLALTQVADRLAKSLAKQPDLIDVN